MTIFNPTPEYMAAIIEAGRIANTKDVVTLASEDVLRINAAQRIMQLHNAILSTAVVQDVMVTEFMGAVADSDVQQAEAEEEPEVVMPRPDFSEAFVDAFRALVREEGFTIPGGASATEYAVDAVGSYYGDAAQRRRGPEWCAEQEYILLRDNAI